MATSVLQASLNAGEISRLALARIDLAKLRVATERQVNFLPHILGPTMLRPGTAHVEGIPGDAEGWLGEFYFSETEKALLVMTAAGIYFLVNGAYLTRAGVTAAVANGNFDTDLSSWTVSDEAGATSTWATGGYASLLGTGANFAQIDQRVTVAEPNTEHALRVVIARNDVLLQVGTAQGDSDYINATLAAGSYSLAFTPTGDFWIRAAANNVYSSLVDSITVEVAGTVSLPVPYSTKEHFDALRYDQSGDVLFVAVAGFQQRRIERRSADSRSWGIALYHADDGPFRLANISSTTIAASTPTGLVTLTASRPLFKPGHVGALFKLTHTQQRQLATLAAAGTQTGEIRVSGLSARAASGGSPGNVSSRGIAINVSGTFSATIQLQRSIGEPGSWSDVSGETYTAPVAKSYDDGLDNQIIYYRLACTAYTSGSAVAVMAYAGSSQAGIARVTSVTSSTSALADVLLQFGDTVATSDWSEGEWSDYRGWPAAVVLHDGRLAWFPSIKAHLSVSDAFASFDDAVVGDSGPLNRTIATGGLDGIRWAVSAQRLIAATAAQEISIRSSSFDGPLTPSEFTARVCGDNGAAKGIRAANVQGAVIFFGAANRLFKMNYDVNSVDYRSSPIDRLKPEMFAAGAADIAVQRKPDNAHLWVPLKDGTAALVAYNEKEEVEALVSISTDGSFERVAVLPGNVEDDVYFLIARTIGGVTKRYIEKLAKRTEAQGGTLSKTVDSHIVYSGAATAVITGLSHLEGESVAAWADGAAVSGAFTVTGGQITLPAAASNVVVGLPYTGQIKTAKLGYAAERGTALTMQKRVSRVGLVMADVSCGGVRIGRDFDHMTGLPATYRGKPLTAGQVLTAYDAVPAAFNGGWDSDSRVCIEVSSPHCATIMGLALHMETNEPIEPAPAPRNR